MIRASATRFIAVGAAALTVATLAACSASPTDDPVPIEDLPAELTIALPRISPPYTGSSQANAALRITTNVFDPLIFWDPETGEFSPGLATEWDQVSATELELTIRDGVTFHDGTEMTVDDVAFTLSAERLWGPDALEPSSIASTFSAVDVIDEDTVKITTSQPDPALLQRLASPIGFVVPKALIEGEGIDAFGVNPVGTGPYAVETVAPGERVSLVRNVDYWGGEAPYEALNFVEVAEVSARVSGLATGEYNIVTNLAPDQTSVVEANGQEVVSVEVNNIVMLALMTARTDSPVADERVRQAMQLAIDRATIINSLWGGLVSVPDGLNLPIFGDFFDDSRTAAPYDPEEAQALLEEAGYAGEPIVLRFISGYYTNVDRALEVMQTMWTEAGLNVVLEGVADFTLLDIPSSDAYMTSSNIALADPVSPLWTDWVSPRSVYVAQGRGIVSPELTAAGEELSTSFDEQDRQAAYDAATELWGEELPAIAFWQPVEIYGVGDGVTVSPDPRYWLRLADVPSE